MTQSSSSITNSRLCNYNCGTLIYWNSNKKAFVEVETGNKHFCQSARTKPTTFQHNNVMPKPTTQQYRPTFTTGSRKPYTTQQQKQSTKNSI